MLTPACLGADLLLRRKCPIRMHCGVPVEAGWTPAVPEPVQVHGIGPAGRHGCHGLGTAAGQMI